MFAQSVKVRIGIDREAKRRNEGRGYRGLTGGQDSAVRYRDQFSNRIYFRWPKHWYSDPITLSTVVIACATVINLVIAALLWQATSGYTRITKQIFEDSHRPYVGIENIISDLDSTGAVFQVHAQIKNFGAVPANELTAEAKLLRNSVEVQKQSLEREPILLFPNLPLSFSIYITDRATLNAVQTNAQIELRIHIKYKGMAKQDYVYDHHAILQPDKSFALTRASGT